MAWTRVFTAPLSMGLVVLLVIQLWTLLLELRRATHKESVIVAHLTLRCVALCAFFAFYSLAIQVRGLLGEKGLYPITQSLLTLENYLLQDIESEEDVKKEKSFVFHVLSCLTVEDMRRHLLRLVYFKFSAKENLTDYLQRTAWIDVAVAAFAVVYPHPLLFVWMYIAYYSYKRVSGPFLNFQWDILLLESLFVCVPLSLSLFGLVPLPQSCSRFVWWKTFILSHVPLTISLWLLRVLLFRLLFGSGMVKGYGSDKTWHTSYTAMAFHFLTQPLPNVCGRWVHLHASPWIFKAITVGSLVAEIPLPLLYFVGSERMNALVALGHIGLQMSICLTGSFGFFNYLTMALSLSLLNDNQLFLPRSVQRSLETSLFASPDSFLTSHYQCVSVCLCLPMCLSLFLTNTVALTQLLQRTHWLVEHLDSATLSLRDLSLLPAAMRDAPWLAHCECVAQRVYETLLCDTHAYMLSVWYVGAQYALFANMTKFRNELRIEVSRSPGCRERKNSDDEQQWHLLSFRYKPDDEWRAPVQVCPPLHLPRLDWLMWFLVLRVSPAASLSLSPSALSPTTLPRPAAPLSPSSSSEDKPTMTLRDARAVLPQWFLALLVALLEREPDVLSLFPQESKALLTETASDAEEELCVRVRLFQFGFHSDDVAGEERERGRRRFWDAALLGTVVAPSSQDDLAALCDALSVDRLQRRRGEAPAAETAKEIILRTLFKRRDEQRNKREKEEQKND